MKKRSYSEYSALTLELSLFLSAGADFSSALVLLSEKTEEREYSAAMKSASCRLDSGEPLSAVLYEEGLLPREGAGLVHVGEETGRVEEALLSLSAYYRRREESARALRSAVTYPAVLTVVMLAVVLVLLTKVLPIFSDIYASLGSDMGAVATFLCELGLSLNRAMPFILMILAALAAFALLCAVVKPLRAKVSAFFGRIFSNTKVAHLQATARFADAFSMAIMSGFTPSGAVASAAQVLSDTALSEKAREAVEMIEAEADPVQTLRKCGLLPADECKLLSLGISAGAIERTAEECSRRIYIRAEDRLERTIASIEPVMVVVTSLLVGLILLSVMLPLSEILAAIG